MCFNKAEENENNMKHIYLFILGSLLLGGIVKAQVPPNLYKNIDDRGMNHWVDSIFNTLSLEEKVGQLFMIVADPGKSYHERILNNIRDEKIGGVLFSGGRLLDQAESINLYQGNSKIPLLISFDGEWGLAMRLKEDTPLFPRNMTLGAVQDNYLLERYGAEVGRECNELGVHINFAPVLDVNVNPANPVIGNRSFGEDPEMVAEKGIAYARGLESKNVIAVGKHFPGHGDTASDSHHTLPVIKHSQARLDSVELLPFKRFINSGFAGVMTGHLSVPALDNKSNKPTSLSPYIVSDLLINEMKFTGLTFTDALVMGGASSTKQSTCVLALLAGNDILLSPGKPIVEFQAVMKAVNDGTISIKSIEEKCRKVLAYKYIVGLNKYKPILTSGLKDRINSSYSETLIQDLSNEAITLLKNEDRAIPVKLSNKKIAVVSFGEEDKTAFQETINLYAKVDFFNMGNDKYDPKIFEKLKNYDTLICGIHSNKVTDYPALQALCKQKEVHLCFFVSPYRLTNFKTSILSARSVTMAYENIIPIQKAAAEMMMGGLPAKGKLPVSVQDLFDYGTGINTEKTRLSYGYPEEVGMSRIMLDSIEMIVNEGIKEQAFPSCQVLIAKEGVVVYNRSFGHHDYSKKKELNNSDIFDLASVTKAVATTPAIMKLLDSKKISINDRISTYLPPLKGTDKSDITIKEALFHETGLPSFLPFYICLIDQDSYSGPLFSFKKSDVYTVLYDKKVYMRKDYKYNPAFVSMEKKEGFKKQIAKGMYACDDIENEVLSQIVNSKLNRTKNYLYSDLNFILLKSLSDKVSKQSFDSFLEKTIYQPLGAYTTTFLPLQSFEKERIVPTEKDDFLRNQLLQGYVHDEAAATLGGVSGNAGLFSNANDLAKVLQMFLNNGSYGDESILGQATVRLFTRTKSSTCRRGLGFDKPDPEKPSRTSAGTLSPLSSYGHSGYTGTCFWVDPDNQLIYIFLSNRVYPSRTHTNLMSLDIRPRIHDLVYRSFLQRSGN